MLQRLSIRNYALIEELDITFSKGMTTITGETGAGKSILLGALALLIGSRADSSSLLKKNVKCVVEGTFHIDNYQLQEFFKINDLDYEKETLLRREINPEGKSRAFVNDTPVNLSVMKELGNRLIEIHSQHETLTLNDSGFQMLVADSYAGNQSLLKKYLTNFKSYTSAIEQLKQLRAEEEKAKQDSDYYQFLFNELDEAGLKSGEQQTLEQELEILNNSEEIKTALSKAGTIINGDEENLLSALASVQQTIQSVTKVFPKATEILERIKSAQIELKDIGNELESLERDVIIDPKAAEIIADRLDVIYKLQQKHKVNTVDELIAVHEGLSNKLMNMTSLEDQIRALEKSSDEFRTSLKLLAQELHDKRKKAIPEIEKNVATLLRDLGMKHAVLKIELNGLPADQFRTNGTDTIKFLFSANKGVEYRELHKVASGGELSRVMLAVKSIIARLSGLPTIIFDEIDTGISGEVAHKVGNILVDMARERQVIAITHLPQMAVKGEEHFFVYKITGKELTTTAIKKLTKAERVEEIAKMLSGEQPTKAALANARELLGV
ncbi:MAG: DNA repair protein RecN [Bacteroidetes bacterium]|nr:DNA repair protein RecN [Bacteroidota bacterium]MBK9425448.1 DNA repair protein RecN [Bacteroidota bacterium]MBL0073040.1 DNA repair protein RecN [Bacteroidota bacterium]